MSVSDHWPWTCLTVCHIIMTDWKELQWNMFLGSGRLSLLSYQRPLETVHFLWSSHSSDINFETFEIWDSIPFILSLFLRIPEVSFPLSTWIKLTVIYWLVNHFVHVFYKAHDDLILAKFSFAWLVDLRVLCLQYAS